jgi:hypothetical protein
MLSRILWISFAGIALIAGIAVQDGGVFFGWTNDHDKSVSIERKIEEKVDRAIDRSFDHMQVETADGREIDVPAETKRALGDAVGRLIKAEADLAVARAGVGEDQDMKSAQGRRDQARAEVDRLKTEIKSYEGRATPSHSEAISEHIEREVKEDVRDRVHDAVQR